MLGAGFYMGGLKSLSAKEARTLIEEGGGIKNVERY